MANEHPEPPSLLGWRRRPVGEVIHASSGACAFRYHRGGRRISHSLPADDDASDHPMTFFENLLPDGLQRERLARRLGISDTSTFTMLEAVGGECAGALSLYPGDRPTMTSALRPLDVRVLVEILAHGAVPTSINEGLSLTLAGAQDKLPVVLRGDQLFLSTGGPSTHIIKFPNRDFRGLVDNERFVLELAAASGLPVAASRLWPLGDDNGHALLVERYDRVDGRRLHQEDVCQALGLSPDRKYESDGGPSFVDVVTLLESSSSEPEDLLRLVRWQAFNIAVGNNDGHAKNISFLREPSVRLAPAYDLVCTRAWDALDKKLAFSVHGVHDPGAVGPRGWGAFAKAAKISPRLVRETVSQVSAAVSDHARMVAERLMDDGGDATAIRRALAVIERHAARALRLLELEDDALPKPRRRV
jgi:serine/threonine-protein kinase HipA